MSMVSGSQRTNGELLERSPVAVEWPSAPSERDRGDAGGSNVDAAVNVGWQAAVPVLTSLVTGAAILGFVALVGGAVEWTRAREAGLPPAESVSFMPRASLLANGAEILVPALLAALFAVAALWLANQAACAWSRRERRQRIDDEQVVLARCLDQERSTQAAAAAAVVEFQTATAAYAAKKSEGLECDAEHRAAEEADVALTASRATHDAAVLATSEAREALEEAERQVAASSTLVRVGVFALVLFVCELVLVLRLDGISPAHLVVLGGLATVGTAFAAVIYERDEGRHFAWFAVAAFLAVGAVFGSAQAFALRDHPEVEPAAVLMDDIRPVTGIYVTQTSDRVYLGVRRGADYSLVALPRDQVRGLSVGNLAGLDDVPADSAALARQLCAASLADPPAKHAPRC